ncbi:methionyl-tRNA formyltransferase [Halanaerobium sp. Z-7514]|uniref:Methionyl-tRNA formyltransferase n=1 Tax=Halanaerobium polyolivorans TaxID=2886943 RepID=A0AAW4WXQ6_9FIRM|nr:methionyl-tRNA formyltransferase [Halanaerobium polyolivorans]MCC3144773.1 methionyl-tRNA formyltransferase [Halanaerobium polyolivorans]RQD74715.1 MAG: methionyl-tRNA formyltransferase [Halanaerobium sp. MSAO_Bac5]
MKIIFMGTPDFAVPSLKRIAADSEIEIAAVVTQPDRERGRGQKVQFSAVKKTALDLELPVLQSDNVNRTEFLEKLRAFEADFIVVVAFGQKLSEELLELPKEACINLHASLLPEYRGSSPIHRAIIDGKKVTGNTTMYMGPGWDDGDMIYQQEIKIKRDDTVGDLHNRMADKGAELLIKTLKDIKAGTAPRTAQDDDKATFAYKIDKSLGEIDWNQSAETIYNLVRGVNPWPGAYTYLNGDRIKIWQLEISEQESDEEAGVIIKADNNEILVQSGEGVIAVKKLQPAGAKKLSASDYLNGYDLEPGQKFG